MSRGDTGAADLRAPRQARIAAFVAVALLHIFVIGLLVRAFAPQFTASVTETMLSTFSVTIETPPTSAPSSKAPEPAGAAGEEGKKAIPRAVAAPKPKFVIAQASAPRAASTGSADTAGAGTRSDGTGAGGGGPGTGSGAGGNGPGGGTATGPVKIAGDINSARDYPKATRDLRIGDSVVIVLTVGANGRPRDCRVRKHSRDAQADAITCRLALDRFRFRPATDSAGNPVEASFGWRQRWYFNAPG
jgi:protein TonB